jgi:diguanylate cyclase (GGDEF)-like protein
MSFRFSLNSLTTRMIMLGTVLLLIGALSRVVFLTDYLRDDITELTSTQLLTIANYVAQDIDRDIVVRRDLLAHMAKSFPHHLLHKPQALQTWLGERQDLNPLFSRGLLVLNTDGIVISGSPTLPERIGTSANDRDYFQQALRGEAAIGQPILGRTAGIPVLPMAVPLRDSSGNIRAVLGGISALQSSNFMEAMYSTRIGNSGGLLLISPQHGLFVGSSDPGMILTKTPQEGINKLHDLTMKGFRGTGITVNAKGIEELSATASVPSADWFVVARLPTSEAFTPLTRLRNFVLRNTAIILPIFVIVMILMMRRMMRPLMDTARRADRMTQGEIPLESLPVVKNDEVGHLTAAFNRVLEKLLESRAELTRIAHHDQLTGLPNRKLLADRMKLALARSQRGHGKVAVLFLDLDGFKPINDRFGHDAGDMALCEVTRRLASAIRREDTLARVGGDEFVILLSDLDDSPEAAAILVANKCLAVFERPFLLPQQSCMLNTSIGIALGDADSNPDRLLVAADQAMYRAKEAGRGRFCWA